MGLLKSNKDVRSLLLQQVFEDRFARVKVKVVVDREKLHSLPVLRLGGGVYAVVRNSDARYELGAEDVAGFGSDFGGIEAWPEGLGDPSGFPALLDRLASRGYTQAQLEKLAGGNLWRVLKEAEAARTAS